MLTYIKSVVSLIPITSSIFRDLHCQKSPPAIQINLTHLLDAEFFLVISTASKADFLLYVA